MTDIVYSLIYIIPLIVTGATTGVPFFWNMEGCESPYAPLVVMLLLGMVLTVLSKVNFKQRIIVSGSLLALILGAFLVTTSQVRGEWLDNNGWIWPALILTGVLFFVGFFMLRIRIVKLAVGILFLGLLLSSYWTRLITDAFSVVAIVFLSLVILLEEIRMIKRKDSLISAYVVRVVPVLLLGAVCLYFLPASPKPYDWSLAKRAINKISSDLTTFRQLFEEEDSVGEMEADLGFSDESAFYGKLSGKEKEMMSILTDSSSPEYLYLDGTYFDEFDGRKWSKSEDNYPYMMDTFETLCALKNVDSDILNDYRKFGQVEITYRNLNTIYGFAPLKSLISEVNVRGGTFFYNEKEIRFGKKAGNNTNYKTKYLIINRNEETLSQLIEAGKQTNAATWDSVRKNLDAPLMSEEYSYEAYLKYRDKLYENCNLKDELSEGVREFLNIALSGIDGDSSAADLSTADGRLQGGASSLASEHDGMMNYRKCRAIAEALSTLEYTTSPGALPSEIDTTSKFLDYLILESKQGYCNSFATAFTLLCRAEGIPARYVHGYRVPRKTKGERSVTNTMAHAYPEAYIEGIGWMEFEPTPAYAAGTEWAAQGKHIFEDEESGYNPYEHYSTEEDGVSEDAQGDAEAVVKWYMIVVPLVCALFVLFILMIIIRIVNIRTFESLEREDKAKSICYRMMTVLGYLGFEKAENETVCEYALRVETQFSENSQEISLDAFSSVFDTVLYSEKKITESDEKELLGEYEAVVSSLSGFGRFYYKLMLFMGRL